MQASQVLHKIEPTTADTCPRAKNGALREVRCPCSSMRPTEQQAAAAFEREGLKVALYERTFIFMARVLTECGNLYTYDGSHGGGQTFSYEPQGHQA